jgi:hypothetical protein
MGNSTKGHKGSEEAERGPGACNWLKDEKTLKIKNK